MPRAPRNVVLTFGTLAPIPLILALAAPAQAVSILLDFEDLPPGTLVRSQYEPRGVVFDFHYIAAFGPARSGRQTLHFTAPENEFRFGPIVAAFTTPQRTVSLFAGDAAGQTATLTAYDAAGAVIAQDGPRPLGLPITARFEVSARDNLIVRVEFATSGRRPVIDDFAFEADAAPPPVGPLPVRGPRLVRPIDFQGDLGRTIAGAVDRRRFILQAASVPDIDISGGTAGRDGEDVQPQGAVSCFGSQANNVSFTYVHEAFDYRTEPASEGACGLCGACAQVSGESVGTLKSLQIVRLHRPRLAFLPSSFGPGVLATFDTQLRIDANGPDGEPIVDLLDVLRDGPPIRFVERDGTDDEVDGLFHDRDGQFRHLELLDGAGRRASSPASAVRAVLTSQENERIVFEVIRTQPDESSSVREGRLIRRQDRNGFAEVVDYVHPRRATDAALGFDRSRLWQVKRLIDMHGVEARFESSAAPVAGRPVITKVILPRRQVVQYRYEEGRLTRVVHPDGSVSRFSISFDPDAQEVALHLDDNAAGSGVLRKTVHVTTPTFTLASGEVVSQPANLVRRIVNGDGELMYRNWEDPANPNVTFVYEGGGRLFRLTLAADGLPLRYAHAAAPFDPTSDDPTSVAFEEVETYEYNEDGALVSRTDALGRTARFVRDELRQVTSTTFRDGTSARAIWNGAGAPERIENALGGTTVLQYDARGNLLAYTVALGRPEQATWRMAYDRRGLMALAIDANGNRTDYVHDGRAFLVAVIEPPDGPYERRAVRRFRHDHAGQLVELTDASGRTVRRHHDGRGRIRAILHPDGSQELFEYGSDTEAGLLVGKRDRNGHLERWRHDRTGRPIVHLRAAGQPEELATRWTYLSGTRLRATETIAGDTTTFTYDARKRLVAITRRPNLVTTLTERFAYDVLDRRVRSVDPYGRATIRVFDARSRVTRVVTERVPGGFPAGSDPATVAPPGGADPAFVVESSGFDLLGRETGEIDVRGFRVERRFDVRGRVIEDVVAAGTPAQKKTQYILDPQGNLLKQRHPRTFGEAGEFATTYTHTGRNLVRTVTEAAGRPEAATRILWYTPTHNVAAERNPRGFVTRYRYEYCCDRLAAVIDPLGFETRYEYDPKGNRRAIIDPNGLRSTFRYDALDRLVTSTNAKGETTRHVFDEDLTDGRGLDASHADRLVGLDLGPGADGSARLTQDPLGATALTIEDGIDRLVREVDPNGNAYTYAYDRVSTGGLVERRIIDPLGHVSVVRTDAAGRERESVDQEGRVTGRSFDASGNLLSTRDPNGNGESCAYDALGRALVCQDALGNRTVNSYDAEGNLTRTVDAAGNASSCSYDGRNRAVACRDRNGAATAWGHDGTSNEVVVRDAEGGVTRREFDPRDLLVKEIFPDGGARRMAYDRAGRLIARTDQQHHTIWFDYDNANRLVKRRYRDGHTDDFTYDAAARVTSGRSGRYGTFVRRDYDRAGRVTAESQRVAGFNYQVALAYDAADHLTSIRYPDGTVSTRDYTSREQLAEVRLGHAMIAQRAYDPAGRPVTTTFGSGKTETRVWRRNDLLEAQSVPGVFEATYAHDPVLRKTEERDARNSAESQTFGYDAEGRLASWQRDAVESQTWELSPVGDWRKTTRNGRTEVRDHNRVHEIVRVEDAPLRHDPRGNLVSGPGGRYFLWDLDNQLAAAPWADAHYVYDAFGRRLAKVVDGKTRVFVQHGLDREEQVLAEYLDGVLDRLYVWGEYVDELLATRTCDGLQFYTSNDVYSVTAAMDGGGTLLERYRYDAYGARTVLDPAGAPGSGSAVGNEIGFTGRAHDSETGLIYFRSRYYDPELGRFISREPTYIEGPSLYQAYFVPHRPDPSGLGPKVGIVGEGAIEYAFCTGGLSLKLEAQWFAGWEQNLIFGKTLFVGAKGRFGPEPRQIGQFGGVGCSRCSESCCGAALPPGTSATAGLAGVGNQAAEKLFRKLKAVQIECSLDFDSQSCGWVLAASCQADFLSKIAVVGQVLTVINKLKFLGVTARAGAVGGGQIAACYREDGTRGFSDGNLSLGAFVEIGVGIGKERERARKRRRK